MFVSEKLIYLQLPKAASTFITSTLTKNLDGRRDGHHNTLESLPEGAVIATSIRNPWDWYVSLWAFGCTGHGGVRKKLNRRSERRRDLWPELYADANDPAVFRRWLKVFMNPEPRDLWPFYPRIPMRSFTGIYTYRLLKLTTLSGEWAARAPELRSRIEVKRHFGSSCVATRFIRCESLRSDVETLLTDLGLPQPIAFPLQARKNPSSHAPPSAYYDDESIELVRSRDPLIVKRFSYEGPSGPKAAPSAGAAPIQPAPAAG